jgi:hypothetical protein
VALVAVALAAVIQIVGLDKMLLLIQAVVAVAEDMLLPQ